MASLEDYNKKTSRQKYANNKTYSEYRQELWVFFPSASYPGLTVGAAPRREEAYAFIKESYSQR